MKLAAFAPALLSAGKPMTIAMFWKLPSYI